MLVAESIATAEPVEAEAAVKGHGYVCRDCRESVVFARGQIVRPHFKHKPDSECAYGKGETWQHRLAKVYILECLRERGLKAAPEVEVLTVEGDRRTDVLLWAPSNDRQRTEDALRRAIEVQHSRISYEELSTRTSAYMAARVPVIWIPVIDKSKLKFLQYDSASRIVMSAEHSTPDWVSNMDELQGHNWIFVPQDKTFWRTWLLPHMRWKESKEWFDPDGTERSSGGYWYEAACARDLYLEGPFSFPDLRLLRVNYSKKKSFPSADSWRFLVHMVGSVEPGVPDCPVEQRKKPHIVNGRDTGYYTWESWLRIGEVWVRSDFRLIEELPSPIAATSPATATELHCEPAAVG